MNTPIFTEGSLSLLFVLLTVVLIVLIIFWCLKERKDIKVHIYSLVGICAFLIIELCTYICVGNDKSDELFDRISFASTLSSLILSIVAIIHTIVVSRSGESQNAKMELALKELQNVIKEYQTKFQLLDKISQDLDNTLNITRKTQQKVENIYDTMGQHSYEVNSSNTHVSNT